MKKAVFFLGLMLFSLLFNSCGVMFGGSKYNGTIKVKNRPNADIYVNGQKIGTGQAKGLFPRNKPLVVEVQEEGCPKKTQTFEKSLRAGNLILSAFSFGLIGLGVDLGTGASYKPAHNSNSAIKKINDKDYEFEVDYSECNK